MGWNPKKSASKAGGAISGGAKKVGGAVSGGVKKAAGTTGGSKGKGTGLAGVGKKVGGVLSKAGNSKLGKLAGPIGVTASTAGGILQGKNPLANTPVGDILQAAGLGDLAGLSPDTVKALVDSMTGPRPEIPTFKSALDASGNLASQYQVQAGPAVNAGSVAAGTVNAGQLDLNALASDTRALDAMRERAMSQGDSAWMKAQLEKQGLEELSARDMAAQQAMSGGVLARSALAMKGGLGGGSSERIAMQMGRDMNAARQGIGRAGQMDRLNLAIADDQTKQALLAQTSGLDLQHGAQRQDMSKFNIGTALDADKFNVGTALDASKFNTGLKFDADKYNSGMQFDANKFNTGNALGALQQDNLGQFGIYQEKMKGYAAGKQGDAIANSGKK